jgi:tRNA threonylcarbamoyladenosine biosynthesis protein TsaE
VTRLHAPDADATRVLGARLAQALLALPAAAPVLVTLAGDLGAGKTTFVSGLLTALGHQGPVRSPTYTLIEPYRLHGRDVQHCDFYRLRHPDELDDLGWRDLALPGAILLVEWPEKAEGRLGSVDLAVYIEYDNADGRLLTFAARSAVGDAIMALLESTQR